MLRARDVAPAHLPRQRQSVPGEIESVGLAELLQHREVRPGAAAAIEQPRRRAARDRARDLGPDEPAESAKPEVRLLGEMRELEQAIHAVGEARGLMLP